MNRHALAGVPIRIFAYEVGVKEALMPTQVLYFLGDPHLSSRTPRSRIDDYGETCKRKLEFVCKQAVSEDAILIMAGDVFHTPVQVTSFVNAIIRIIRKSGARIYTLAGNHDVVNYNFAKVADTSLGSLIVSGVVPLLRTIKIGKWRIVAHDYGEEFSSIEPTDEHPFLMIASHSFYATSHPDKMNLEQWEVEESQAALLFLGHDHTQYPPMEVEGTTIVRPGSMTRATSHTCNYSRTPAYARVEFDTETGDYSVTYEVISHLPASDVYMIKEEATNGVDSFDDVRSLIDEIKATGAALNPFEVLDAMDLPSEVHGLCVDYMHAVGIFRNANDAIEHGVEAE